MQLIATLANKTLRITRGSGFTSRCFRSVTDAEQHEWKEMELNIIQGLQESLHYFALWRQITKHFHFIECRRDAHCFKGFPLNATVQLKVPHLKLA